MLETFTQLPFILFALAVAGMVLWESYFLYQDFFLPFIRKCGQLTASVIAVAKDFRSGVFYKPWSKQPIVIPPTKKNLLELGESAVLSQRAVYADMFGFKFTMNKLDHNEQNAMRFRLYGRVLQLNGPAHLSGIFDDIRRKMLATFSGFEQQAHIRSKDQFSLSCTHLAREMTLRMMSVAFFGNTLASEPAFSEAIIRYPKELATIAMAFQMTPSFLFGPMHKLITRNGKAMHTIQNRLRTIIGADCKNWHEKTTVKQNTVLYNIANLGLSTEYWTPELLSQALLGIWFGASHQPWMFVHFILLELCRRPEWQRMLRESIGDLENLSYEDLEALPLLDSFMKETIRVNPLDRLVVRRKALSDFTFTEDDQHIPNGQVVCVSSYDLLRDPGSFASPETFDGHRFMDKNSEKFSSVSKTFPIWGLGSLACPGRFYATVVMKLLIAFIVTNYDIELCDTSQSTTFRWESLTVPRESTRIMLKRVHP